MPSFRNHLLRSIPESDLRNLSLHFSPVRLDLHRYFERAGEPIRQICFPEDGVISVVAGFGGGRQIESGFIGFEGMTGIPLVMGREVSSNDAYVQLAGHGNAISADAFQEVLAASPTLKDRLLLYAHAFMVQVTETAVANGRANIDERLARWLLMADDRVEGSELPLTHEFLSVMLGVRRPGITDALHRIEGDLLIRARRGMLTIRDRAGLERLAQNSYGVPELEYERLFSKPWRSTGRVRGETVPPREPLQV